MKITHSVAKCPWYADIANYLVCKVLPPDITYQQRKKLLHDVKKFHWDEPYLFKHCSDGIIRRCIPKEEVHNVISQCHGGLYGGHASTMKTQAKVLQAGLYWLVFLRTCMNISSLVMHVSGRERLPGSMKCNITVSLK
jgi:hypothetical protein